MLDKNYSFSPILLNAGIAKHNADWNYNNISNPFFRIYLILEGRAQLKLNDVLYTLKPGYVYLIPSFSLHNDMCSGEFSLYYIHVYENQKRAISIFDEYDFPVEVPADKLSVNLIERLLDLNPNKELQQYDPKTYTNDPAFMKSLAGSGQMPINILLETKGILCQVFSRFISKAISSGIKNDARIWSAVHYIRDHINNKIKISELAGHCNLSNDHLIRLFKKELNTTPIDYINRKKIEKAQLMLVIENNTIKEVAYALAFENISYFNKVFRKILNKTPTEYKKEMIAFT